MAFKSTKDIVIGKVFKGLFLGPNGFGKTVAVASFWERYKKRNQRIFIADLDGRIDPIKLMYPDADNIVYETYGPSNFMRFIADYNLVLKDPTFGLFCPDSFTSLSMSSVTFQMEAKGVGDHKLTKGGLVTPTWDETNGETMLIATLLDRCKESGKDIIFTAHPYTKSTIPTEANEKKERIYTIASYGHKINLITPGYFNEIYNFTTQAQMDVTKPPKRLIYTFPNNEGGLGKTALPLSPTLDITSRGLYPTMRDELKMKGIEF